MWVSVYSLNVNKNRMSGHISDVLSKAMGIRSCFNLESLEFILLVVEWFKVFTEFSIEFHLFAFAKSEFNR